MLLAASLLPPSGHVTATAAHLTLVVLAVPAVIVGVVVIVQAFRERTSIPVLVMLGGVVALPIEPMWDVICHFYFPFDTHPQLFTALGRPIPLYLAFVYPFFIGWGSYLAYRLIDAGWSAAAMLRFAGAFAVLDAVIEIAGVRAHVWSYYGHQAFTIFGWPVYFAILNGAIPVLGGCLTMVLVPRLSGWSRPLALPAVVPTVYVGIYAIAGWPTWVALGSNVPRAVVWGAATLTMAMTFAVLRLVTAAIGSRAASVARAPRISPTDREPGMISVTIAENVPR